MEVRGATSGEASSTGSRDVKFQRSSKAKISGRLFSPRAASFPSSRRHRFHQTIHPSWLGMFLLDFPALSFCQLVVAGDE